MAETQDRRAPGVNRVTVTRSVDICGRDATVPAFEAESVELSGRGMHVRTPYLPRLGAPLVCRLEEDGREIVVEGVVAWQRDREGGGEFGIQFTALDSGSVEALKGMCGLDDDARPGAPAAAETLPAAAPPAPAGMPVKLHIDGLGAPMKARVRAGSTRKVQVGSNLEFLKVGRGLEIEDVEQGDRRGARIDAVSIAIDPETQVPQLVVALRYDGEDATPEPSVIGDEDASGVAPIEASEAAPPVRVDDDDDDGDGADDEEEPALRGKVDAFAVSVGKAAKNTGEKLAGAGGSAAAGFAKWAKASGSKLAELAARRNTNKRRSTSRAVSAAPSTQRLRPQNGEREAAEAGPSRRQKLVAGASASAILVVAVGAFALTGHSKHPTPQGTPAAAPPPLAVLTPPAAPGAVAAATPVPGTPVVPGAVPGAAPAVNAAGPHAGVVANVPLFGPTPMATLEPAPLGPAPDEIAAAAPKPAHATEERMDDDEPKSSKDEAFSDSSSKDDDKAEKSEKSADAKAESVSPWGQGKLHLPIVHRIKLDRPGAAIEGKHEAAGFSIVIPDRKVEGSGLSITKRDDRISDVRFKNGPSGARITFVFRSRVPGYKVRLRKSYVEVLVSSPGSAK